MENSFETPYREALILIKKFHKINEAEFLLNATEKLAEALKYNEKFIDAYIWLAYIFFVFNKENEAKEFIKKAESIDPNYMELLNLNNAINEIKAIRKQKLPDNTINENTDVISETLRLYG